MYEAKLSQSDDLVDVLRTMGVADVTHKTISHTRNS